MIYDGGAESWGPEDIRAVLVSAKEVQRALAAAGHEVTHVAVRPDVAWFQAVRGCDLVFNLCEGIEGVSALELAVASAIDLTGIPYTGCSAWTSTICHRKPVLNAILQAHGLPIPRWHLIDNGPLPDDWPLPSIVKPAAEDASIGIEQTSVVETRRALERQIREVQDEHGGVLIQRYVAGREIAVGFVGDHVLPLSEIDFTHMPDGAWPIVSFSAKWHEESPEYGGTEPVCPAPVDKELAAQIITVATAAWRIVEGRGYGRVDLRVDVNGQPWVLEVNPNPDLSMNAGLARMARAHGWTHEALVNEIVRASLESPVAPATRTRPPAAVASSLRTASFSA